MRIASFLLLAGLALPAAAQRPAERFEPGRIIAMERAALDRWGKGDPQGYIEIMAPSVTYFDPFQERRVDGLPAMKALLAPLTGKIRVDRYDMLQPSVQHHGEVALLTFNLVSYQKGADGTEHVVARWNSTETYARVDGQWRIVHSHWSFTRPELKQAISEGS